MTGSTHLLRIDAGMVPYAAASRWQSVLHARRVARQIEDVVLLLEHPHVYTLGRRFRSRHLLGDAGSLRAMGAEVHEADRGGSITYHGPGQLVAYPIVDLRPPGGGLPDIIGYLRLLERVVVEAVSKVGVVAGIRPGLTGVWAGERKLASIGVNISRGVAKHGLALNVSTDLSYFRPIVPCGIDGCTVTSLEELLGSPVDVHHIAELVVRELARRLDRELKSVSLADVSLLQEPEAVGAR
jgi:lipoate-protein ligase B